MNGVSGVTSREFNQDAARVEKAALNGPVFINDRGRPRMSCCQSRNISG